MKNFPEALNLWTEWVISNTFCSVISGWKWNESDFKEDVYRSD